MVGLQNAERDEEFNHTLLLTRPQIITEDNSQQRDLHGILTVNLHFSDPSNGGRVNLYWGGNDITVSALGGWSTPTPIRVGSHVVSEEQEDCEIHDWHWIMEAFSVVGTQESSSDGDVTVTFSLDPTHGEPDSSVVHTARITVDGCQDATLTPDPETHNDFNAVTILPGDEEKVLYQLNYSPPEGFEAVWFRVVDTTIAQLKQGSQSYVRDLPSAGFTGSIELHGRQEGFTELQVWYGHPDIPGSTMCTTLDVAVGGTLEVFYSDVPTFRSGPHDPTIPLALMGGAGGGVPEPPVDPNTFPIVSRPNPIQRISDEVISELDGSQDSTLKMRLEDAYGRPKPTAVFVKVREGYLEIDTQPGVLDRNGEAQVVIRSGDLLHDTGPTMGAHRAQVLFLLGKSATKHEDTGVLSELGWEPSRDDSDIEKFPSTTAQQLAIDYSAPVGSGMTQHFKHQHFNTLREVVYTNIHFANDFQSKLRTGISINYPVMNHVWLMVLAKWLKGGQEFSYDEQELLGTFGIDSTVNVNRVINQYEFYLNSGSLPNWLLEIIDRLPSTSYTPFGGSGGVGVDWKAIAAEIAFEITKAQIPGADIIDLFVEYFWRPVIKDETPNHMMGILSLVGLLADFGHLIPVVGTPWAASLNVLVGGLRATIKIMYRYAQWGGDSLIKHCMKFSGSVADSIQLLFEYIWKFPGGVLDIISKTISTIDQWKHMLVDKVTNILPENIAQMVRSVAQKSGFSLGKEAAEGGAHIIRAAKQQKLEELLEIATDFPATIPRDVLEESFQYARSFTDDVISGLDDEALEGLISAVKKIDPTKRVKVKELIEGSAFAGETDITNLCFNNFKRLEETPGAGKFVEQVHRDRNIRTATNYPDASARGSVFEGTVNVKVLDSNGSPVQGLTIDSEGGPIISPGRLVEIAKDGDVAWKNADTITDYWALQVKRKSSGNFGVGDFKGPPAGNSGHAYMMRLRLTALSNGKTPIVVSNQLPTQNAIDLFGNPEEVTQEMLTTLFGENIPGQFLDLIDEPLPRLRFGTMPDPLPTP